MEPWSDFDRAPCPNRNGGDLFQVRTFRKSPDIHQALPRRPDLQAALRAALPGWKHLARRLSEKALGQAQAVPAVRHEAQTGPPRGHPVDLLSLKRPG